MNNLQDVYQLNYLEVTGIAGFKPRMRCFMKFNQNLEYLYLGKHKGDYYVHKKIRLRNPHIWLRRDNVKFSIVTLAGLYPCSTRFKDVPNVLVDIDRSQYVKTMMQTAQSSDVDFSPTWPHSYLTDHGEWKGSPYLLQLQYQLTVSKNQRFWIQSFDEDNFNGFIQDSKMTLRLNSTTTPIDFRGVFHIQNKQWSGSMEFFSKSWRQLLTEFFPTRVPFHSIDIAPGFKEKLIRTLVEIDVSFSIDYHSSSLWF